MPTPSEFRTRFKDYAGTAVFSRFIKALNRPDRTYVRLRFWQEDLWQAFVTENPDCYLSYDELTEVLRICELHEVDLVPHEVPAFRGCIDYVPEYLEEKAASFPHAPMKVVMVPPDYKPPSVATWICPTCDAIQRESTCKRT
jgi:hypothetical protein